MDVAELARYGLLLGLGPGLWSKMPQHWTCNLQAGMKWLFDTLCLEPAPRAVSLQLGKACQLCP